MAIFSLWSIFQINRLLRLFFGCVKFTFTDGFCEDFINECLVRDLNIINVRRTDNGLTAECSPEEYASIADTARKCGGRTRILKKSGVVFLLSKMQNRMGLSVGIVLGIAVFSLLSGFVWDVRVTGNETLTSSQISDFLAEQGLRPGVHWKSVDKDVCESLVMAEFDEVAWVHINRLGTCAQVEINETEPKPEMTDSTKASNLKATKDGTIISCVVYNGWQQAFKGDAVIKGDILVSGVYESEHAEENMFAHADGLFIAQTENSFSHTVSREQKRKRVTSVKNRKALSLFGLYIPLYFGKIPDKNADVNKTADYLKINNRPVPIGVINIEVTSYEIYSYTMNDDELLEMLNAETEEKINSLYGSDNVLHSDIAVSLQSDKGVASGSVSALENIGEVVEFYDIKDISD